MKSVIGNYVAACPVCQRNKAEHLSPAGLLQPLTLPEQVVYGRDPPRLLSYVASSSRVEAIDNALLDRDLVMLDIRNKLQQDQVRMKDYYDKGHSEVAYDPGSLVWLRLHPYHQKSVAGQLRHKLAPRFFGPFPMLRRIGEVAYELQLPSDCKLHSVFHVSLLKAFKGIAPTIPPTLPPLANGRVVPMACSIL
ncbi:uncharacterized protein LOC142180108 [Nicotiana tabacum]|uniref:Uncharacterized protein LOC142180108 n=1 Tax=Nicotiana tabacum TaxID=4097 RepID=A0AC58UCB7_TOBAC